MTGGDRTVEVPADRINLEFVLPNKVMVGTVNANREYFELGVHGAGRGPVPGMARAAADPSRHAAGELPGLVDTLTMTKGAIKVFCEVVGFDRNP